MPSNDVKAKLCTATCFFTDILYALDPELRIDVLENRMKNMFQGMAPCKHVESSDGTFLWALENTCLRLHVGSLFVDDLPVVAVKETLKHQQLTVSTVCKTNFWRARIRDHTSSY